MLPRRYGVPDAVGQRECFVHGLSSARSGGGGAGLQGGEVRDTRAGGRAVDDRPISAPVGADGRRTLRPDRSGSFGHRCLPIVHRHLADHRRSL